MEKNLKNNLKKLKATLEEKNRLKNKLEHNQEKISKKLEIITDEQIKLIEYNNYKNNSHIAIGAIALVGSLFITNNVLDQDLLYSILISLGVSSTSLFGTNSFFKKKIKKLKESNPTINFENGNVDENQKKIQLLLQKQMENSKKITDIRETIEENICRYEELINDENTNLDEIRNLLSQNSLKNKKAKEKQKEKILVMTIQ